jgi:hypothetical protein
MKRLLKILAAVLGLAAGEAYAADLAAQTPAPVFVKAPATPGYPYQGSGIYFGVGAIGEVANASIAAQGAGTNLYSAGAALEGVIGYQWALGSTNWMALEASASYTNLGNTQVCAAGVSCTVSNNWGFEQRVLFGFPITAVLAVLPNLNNIFPTLPTPPAGTVTTGNHPYLMAGIHEDDTSATYGLGIGQAWTVRPAIGIGILSQWTQGLVVDVRAEYSFANSSFGIGPGGAMANVNQGSKTLTAITFKY